jgi:serine/threonine protein phosphatase PrpC
VLIINQNIYSGSVGDSRAILASSKSPSKLPVPNAALSDKETLQEIRQRRNSFPDTKVWPIQLTLDQKPNDAEERKRIESHGGRVQRLVDEFHNRIGPYRVWEKKGNYPGLAMSRSIGDVAAKRIGVISTPIFTQHAIDSENDLFLIIASDGVWDVMANEDVANFVECYRTACKANVVDNRNTEINTQNACIAQILAEEARIRWYSIVEEEDVIIDDISCVIIELQIMESARDLNFIKSPAPLVEGILKSSTEFELVRAPSILEVNIRDPKRSSIVSESNPKVEIN